MQQMGMTPGQPMLPGQLQALVSQSIQNNLNNRREFVTLELRVGKCHTKLQHWQYQKFSFFQKY
jgi:hypothetical protein